MPDHAAAAGLSVPVLCYEQLLDEAAESGALSSFSWPKLHEDSPAGLCYTSGTTGNPKVSPGVLHCSLVQTPPEDPAIRRSSLGGAVEHLQSWTQSLF
jgi:hypothetical protein